MTLGLQKDGRYLEEEVRLGRRSQRMELVRLSLHPRIMGGLRNAHILSTSLLNSHFNFFFTPSFRGGFTLFAGIPAPIYTDSFSSDDSCNSAVKCCSLSLLFDRLSTFSLNPFFFSFLNAFSTNYLKKARPSNRFTVSK